jgi:hypothetical protein
MSANAVKPVRRTRYINGIALPRVADGRGIAAKRFRALVRQFARDLGDGELSAADQALVRQAAHLILEAEAMQVASITGERVDADSLVRVNSEARRVIGMLQAKGAKSAAAAPMSLHDIVARHAAERANPPTAEGDD